MRTLPILLLAVACTAEQPPITRLLPEISVVPGEVAFGERTSPLTHAQTLFVSNGGRATLELDVQLDDPEGVFGLDVTSATIEKGDTLALPVTFTPPTFLDYAAELVLASNDEDDPVVRVAVTGTGVAGPVPDIDLSTRAIDFGPVDGEATQVLTITNQGTAPLQLGEIGQAGSGAFELLTRPSGQIVAPGNDLPVVVRYAPADDAGDSGTLTFPSDDPDEPSLDVVLLGNGGADFPYPEARIDCPGTVDPPRFVDLDGLGSIDPGGNLPLTYAWTLAELPEDVDGNPISAAYLTSPTGEETRLWADAVGTYVVELVVTNALGVRSAPARCTVEAIPAEDLLVELTWNTARADLDLHLARRGAALFHVPDDVSFCNRRPSWGSTDQSPRLDLDDRAGFGPENVSLQSPADGDYEVRVHYFDDAGDDTVTATVRVYVLQTLALQLSKNLDRDEVWDVASVRWPAATVAARSGDPAPASRRQCPP